MLVLTPYASEIHDGHSVHYDGVACPVTTNRLERAITLNSLPIPEVQGRGKTVIGMAYDTIGQMQFIF